MDRVSCLLFVVVGRQKDHHALGHDGAHAQEQSAELVHLRRADEETSCF